MFQKTGHKRWPVLNFLYILNWATIALRSLTATGYDRPYLSGLNHLSWEIKTNENAFEKKGHKRYNQSIIKLSSETAFTRKTHTQARKLVTRLKRNWAFWFREYRNHRLWAFLLNKTVSLSVKKAYTLMLRLCQSWNQIKTTLEAGMLQNQSYAISCHIILHLFEDTWERWKQAPMWRPLFSKTSQIIPICTPE